MAAPPVPSYPTGLTHRSDAVLQQHREQPCLPASWRHLQDSSYRIHFGSPSVSEHPDSQQGCREAGEGGKAKPPEATSSGQPQAGAAKSLGNQVP